MMACLWYQCLQNKMDKTLTPMTFDREPCQLVRALSQWWRIYGSKINNRRTNPNPYDSLLGILSVCPNMVYDPSFGALSQWWRLYGSKIKKMGKI